MIKFSDHSKHVYAYDATGKKLRAEYHTPIMVVTEPQVPDMEEEEQEFAEEEQTEWEYEQEWGEEWEMEEEELIPAEMPDENGEVVEEPMTPKENNCKPTIFFEDDDEIPVWNDYFEVPCEVTTVDYCGDFIYVNGTLKKILFPSGYMTFTNDDINQPEYHFYITDHQGNVRVVANQDGTIEQINHYYPYGGLMGESTNSDAQPYKYNGKELDRHHGLDWYDYGARWYNGISWMNPDPHAESYYDVTPYGYCHNNPMNKIDPTGMDGIATIDFENRTIVISQTFYYNKNSEGLIQKAIVTDIEINNFSLGQMTIPSEISLVNKDGFPSKTWNVDGWSVSFTCDFIGLDSDKAVNEALKANPAANALCYDKNMEQNGTWDPASRTLTLGPSRGGLGPERGSTINHEIGHSWGLPHENLMPNSPIYGVEDNGKGKAGTGIMSYGNYRTIKQYEVEYGVEKILKNIPDNHPSSMKLHIR